jgi:hypothetical protein
VGGSGVVPGGGAFAKDGHINRQTLGHSHWWTPRYIWDIKKWILTMKFLSVCIHFFLVESSLRASIVLIIHLL